MRPEDECASQFELERSEGLNLEDVALVECLVLDRERVERCDGGMAAMRGEGEVDGKCGS